jgi:hypothetical protein
MHTIIKSPTPATTCTIRFPLKEPPSVLELLTRFHLVLRPSKRFDSNELHTNMQMKALSGIR